MCTSGLLPLLNVPLVLWSVALGGLTGLVVLGILELAGIAAYLRFRGFGAGWAVFAGIVAMALSFAVLVAAALLWLNYGCGGDVCLS